MSDVLRRASYVFHAEGKFLFSVASDSVRDEFSIPVGGLVETRESPESAVVREAREEIGVKIEAPVFLGALEDVFEYGRDIVVGNVFCFLAEAESIEDFPEAAREEYGEEVPLEWPSLERLREESRPVFPEGLLELLAKIDITIPRRPG